MPKMHHPTGHHNKAPASATWLATLLLGVASTLPASAAEVAGVAVPDSTELAGKTLALNGAGLRSRFFVRVYVGALYLESPGKGSTEAVLGDAGAKRVSMHIIYDELSQEKVTSAWLDGFRGNTPEAELAAMMPRVEQFNALWPDLKSGDVVHVDFPAGGGVQLTVNDEARGKVDGEDLQRAVLRIWLGEDPADGDLKRGMLGG